jgi:hypothetical protein
MPAAFTSVLSVQVSGFEDIGLLTQYDRLVCDFCSSSQCFACGFLQPTPHDVNLAVRLAVPLAGPAEDLHLLVFQLVTTTSRIVPVTALRAMPGTPIKNPGISARVHISSGHLKVLGIIYESKEQ